MTNPSQKELMEQWVKLTDAIKSLADREPAPLPGRAPADMPATGSGGTPSRVPTSGSVVELTRQRIDFGYRALGALTGRVGERDGDFVVPLVQASRLGELLLLRGLPPEADWAEVRRDRKVELRRIRRFERWEIESEREYVDTCDRYDRFDDGDPEQENYSATHRGRGLGAVRLRDFRPEESIGALLFLDTRFGPVVALGPRLGPAAPLTFG